MLPLIERDTYRHADNDWSAAALRVRDNRWRHESTDVATRVGSVTIGENAVIRFADEKPKRKTPAPKPGRLKVSDGAKALAAFNPTPPPPETTNGDAPKD